MAKEKNKTEQPKVVEGELQARLIKLREDAGFDISQMADALCLSEDVIINLENEDFDLLAEPPYVRGYLRNYAKLGDDDSIELIRCYEALRGADASELDFQIKSSSVISPTKQKRMSPIWGQVILLGIFIGALSLIYSIPVVNTWITDKWNSFSSQSEPTDASNNPSLLGNLPVPAPLPEDETTNNSENSQANSSSDSNSNQETSSSNTTDSNTAEGAQSNTENTSSTNTENNTVTETASNTETPAQDSTTTTEVEEEKIPEAQEIAAASSDGTINIKMVFNKEVWLRIRNEENKNVFEGLNKAGTEKTVELAKPLTFRVGNAQGLSLFIDNKAVDISTYINGSIANFTLE